ncbi:MAG: hypothetical protein MJ126_09325, partial [Lachnospiraceae bacterium]|nr:hypothetical protein [Lachnospiraceae bacterium]
PVVEEIKIEEPVAPVVEEIKAEEPEAPVVEEVKTEEPEAPVVEEVKAEEPEAPVVEEVKVEEPEAPVVEEVKTEEPEAPVVEEIKVEEPVAPVVEEIKSEEPEAPVVEEVKVEEPVAPAVEPSNKKTKEKKEKKKGKGCLIAVIIFLVVGILLALLVALVIGIVIFIGVNGNGGSKLTNPHASYAGYDAYYGDYHGTSVVLETRGVSALSNYYLECGTIVDPDDLLTDQSENAFGISIYPTNYSDASWDMLIYLDDQRKYVSINNLDFVSPSDYSNGGAFLGDIYPENNKFTLSSGVIDDNLNDPNSIGSRLLGITTDASGQYSLEIQDGYLDKNGNISGVLVITVIYDGMDTSYQEKVSFSATKD